MKVIIRDAQSADYDSLAAIFLEARRQAFVWADPNGFRLEDFARQTEGETILVAGTEPFNVVGFISVWEPENFVHHLYVAPAAQRRGIGRALLNAAYQRFKGTLRLKVQQPNHAARDFYRKLGWAETGAGTAEDGPYLLLSITPRAGR